MTRMWARPMWRSRSREASSRRPASFGTTPAPAPAATTLESLQREHILRALTDAHWVIAGLHGAAARLGIKRTSLQYMMRKLQITRPL
jgi:transcriptional regulator with GAF, ATPase, and Fis domain